MKTLLDCLLDTVSTFVALGINTQKKSASDFTTILKLKKHAKKVLSTPVPAPGLVYSCTNI